MLVRVTRSVTKDGEVYRAGDVITDPTSRQVSLARLFGWQIERDQPAGPSLSSLSKADLVDLAESEGFDTAGLTKQQLKELLEA
jgi:hypothetical protein